MLGPRGEKIYQRLTHYMQHELGVVIARLMGALTAEIEIDPVVKEIQDAHTIGRSSNKSLHYVAGNVGVKALPGEPDRWLRERIQFWVFVHNSSSTLEEVRRAVAWYTGIRRRMADWEASILPKVRITLNEHREQPYRFGDLSGYLEIALPWKLLDLWEDDGWSVGDTAGAFPWQKENENKVIHGRHLALEILELVEILAPAGVKIRLWGDGWRVGDTDGPFPWQDADENRLSGYVEFRGTDYKITYADVPEGCLWKNPGGILEHIPPGLLWRPLRSRGDRVFAYGIDMRDGGRLWP